MHPDVQRSLNVFPAGSNGEFDLPPDLAMVIARGDGCQLWDTSGRRFIDFSMGWGSSFPGHAHPAVVEAVRSQAAQGSNFAYPTAPALELAEELLRLSPALDKVRFCASGTEATMYCLRLARAYTGRPKVLRFEGAYHGGHDVGVTSLFPRRELPFPQAEATSAGLHPGVETNTLAAPFNDIAATSRIIEEHARELAAVICEPLHRCLPPEPGFLEGLRTTCTANDVPLIFDEVVTGFRLAYGGAQQRYGVVPDLVAYGKALGGGYPIGAYGGRGVFMRQAEEHRLGGAAPYVWTASTLGGNPVSCAAALAALGLYRQPGRYEAVFALGERLRAGMRRAVEEAGIKATIIGDGPLAQVVFAPGPIRTYRDTLHSDRDKARRVMLGLFRRGVFLNPMGTKLYLSLAHTGAVCEEFLDHFRAALRV